jgi:hypothetical protein
VLLHSRYAALLPPLLDTVTVVGVQVKMLSDLGKVFNAASRNASPNESNSSSRSQEQSSRTSTPTLINRAESARHGLVSVRCTTRFAASKLAATTQQQLNGGHVGPGFH